MLEQEFYGNTLEHWGISLLIILAALVLNKIISLLNKYVIQKITQKTQNRLDDILFKTLEAPVLFGVMLAAIWFASQRLELGEKVDSIISTSYQALVVINLTWFLSQLVNALIEEFWIKKKFEGKRKRNVDTRLVPVIKRTILVVIWTIGIVSALNNAGIKVSTLIGALGISGLAAALAAQDTIKNIFGGFTIFADQTFRIGDIIKFDGVEGTVEDIGIRSTRVRTYEKRLVTIPNSKLIDALIENISNEPSRRVLMKIGLTYDTTPEKMQEAINILNNLTKEMKFVEKKDVAVFFSEFQASALEITFIYYISKSGDISNVRSEVNMAILEQFNKVGLEFAFPTQTIQLEKNNN